MQKDAQEDTIKAEFPEDYGKYNEYDFNNRITYDEETDSMYVYVAPPQGQVGTVLVYEDGKNMVSIDTDEVNTQVGVEIVGVERLMKKFNINGSARASFGIYNNKNDVDSFVEVVKETKKFFKQTISI